jgi:hypothetical protein
MAAYAGTERHIAATETAGGTPAALGEPFWFESIAHHYVRDTAGLRG